MNALLQVRDLTVDFHAIHRASHRAVDGVSFDLALGEIVGLMGESGCGKTTLTLALLALLDRKCTAVSGSALFHSMDLLTLDESALQKLRGAKVSLISQEPGTSLCPVRRVGDQIAEVFHAHAAQSWKACRREAEDWLHRLGLDPPARVFAAYPHQLSGGQLQRIALAQALICKPELLIADEPTASLDARNQSEFVSLLRTLRAKLGISILLISHTPEIQAALADRIIVMRDGRIVEQGGFAQMFRHPSNPYTRAMLDPSNSAKSAASDPRWVAEYAPQ